MAVGPGAWLRWYVDRLHFFRWAIILGWACIIGLGAWKMTAFFDYAEDNESLPSSAPSYRSEVTYHEHFQGTSDPKNVMAIFMTRNDGTSVFGEDLKAFSLSVGQQFSDGLARPQGVNLCSAVLSYYGLIANGFSEQEARNYVSPDNRSTIIMLRSWNDADGDLDLVRRGIGEELAGQPDFDFSLRFTGSDKMWNAISDSAQHDLLIADGVGIPLALFILGITLRSLRVVSIPICSVIGALTTSLSIIGLIAMHMDLAVETANVVMVLLVSLSIDYALFLLSRYCEELRKNKQPREAVCITLYYSGQTILVSGATLICCVMGLIFFPMHLIRGMGVGAAVAVSLTILVNLTLTPCLLLTFEVFFRNSIKPCPCMRGRGSALLTGSSINFNDDDDDAMLGMDDVPLVSHNFASGSADTLESFADNLPSPRSLWFRWGAFVVRNPWKILTLIVGIGALFVYPAVTFKVSTGLHGYASRTSPFFKTYETLMADFGSGWLFNYKLVMAARDGSTVMSPKAFAAMNHAINELNDLGRNGVLDYRSFCGPTLVYGVEFPYTTYQGCGIDGPDQQLRAESCLYPPSNSTCQPFKWAASRYLNNDASAMYTDVKLHGNLESPSGLAWLRRAFKYIDEANDRDKDFVWALPGGAGGDMDATDRVYDKFAFAIIMTTCVVFVLIALAFRSVSVPMRSVFSIGVTVCMVFGLSKWIYEKGALNFLGVGALAEFGSIFWFPPILCFPIMVGLSLDYDVFLLSRIVEYRKKGFSDGASIINGVAVTGPVVTSAGIIMASSFYALLSSTSALLNQTGFFLGTAVLIDTFIIRTALVPAMMSVLGRWNWWPGRMPGVEGAISGARRRSGPSIQFQDLDNDVEDFD